MEMYTADGKSDLDLKRWAWQFSDELEKFRNIFTDIEMKYARVAWKLTLTSSLINCYIVDGKSAVGSSSFVY
jgi:hypothetical protein